MTRIWRRAAQGLALAGLLVLSACGGGGAPRWGDAEPVSWKGRAPTSFAVHGVNVSRYQASIDWPRAAQGGVSFAFIKATEGGDWADPAFRRHWMNAARAGEPRGAYHFFSLCRTGAEQAAWFIANVPREAGALLPALDLKWMHGASCTTRPTPAQVRTEAQAFIDIVGRHYGQRPIVYTTPDFWRDNQIWLLEGEQPWLRSVARPPRDIYPGEDWTFGSIPGRASCRVSKARSISTPSGATATPGRPGSTATRFEAGRLRELAWLSSRWTGIRLHVAEMPPMGSPATAGGPDPEDSCRAP